MSKAVITHGWNQMDGGFAMVKDMAFLNVYDKKSEVEALAELAHNLAVKLDQIQKTIVGAA